MSSSEDDDDDAVRILYTTKRKYEGSPPHEDEDDTCPPPQPKRAKVTHPTHYNALWEHPFFSDSLVDMRQTKLFEKADAARPVPKTQNRLGDTIRRPPKAKETDYTLFVIGSRVIQNATWIRFKLQEYAPTTALPSLVVLPMENAHLTDQVVREWAELHHIPVHEVPIARYLYKWPRDKYEWQSYRYRNYDMVDLADRVIALWDGKSDTVKHAQEYAIDEGKTVYKDTYEK
jgi:hypothetical protein